MKNWVCHRNLLSGSRTQYLLFISGAPLTFDDALHLLEVDSDFRDYLTELLTTSEHVAYRWETPPVTTNSIDRPFEFILNEYSSLKMRPDLGVFNPYFKDADSATDVMAFPNPSKTATLVVPRQIAEPTAYPHLAAFLRQAPPQQIHSLWQCVATTIRQKLSERRLWISTSGGVVAWLHVRIEGSPKYYSYEPYTEGAKTFMRPRSWKEDTALTSDVEDPMVEERLSRYDYKTAMSVANFEERIDICPNDPRAYYHMGWWWHAMKQYAKAMVHYDHAISLEPAYSEALRDRASLQAACPDPEFRNGTTALQDARMALDLARDNNVLGSDWIHRSYLQTLAAAHAECNDFASAIAIQKKVLEKYCTTRRANETARARLELLESNSPIREEHGPIT